jgi:DNA-binding CsgD family transcriptional regulator/PAS domain-containing protein
VIEVNGSSKLLGTLYAAPTSPGLWSEFLNQLAEGVDAQRVALLSHDLIVNQHSVIGYMGVGALEVNEAYEKRYGQYDERYLRGRSSTYLGRVRASEEIWPEEEMLSSLYYNEFLKPFDIRWACSVTTAITPTEMEHLTVCRGASTELFDRSSLAAIQSVVPHLQTALETRRRLHSLESRYADLETALDLVPSALVLLDLQGKCVYVNTAAEHILQQEGGLQLRNSTLSARNSSETVLLREMVTRATLTSNGKGNLSTRAMLISRPNGRPLQVLVAPFRTEGIAVPGRACVIVFVNDPDREIPLPESVLKSLFNLTPAEVRLALALADGKSLADVADAHRVSFETVRTQVKSIFQKTGTRGQTGLIRLLASVTAPHS